MLNEAEAFTLKNKKYATANDLMTSENSFLNCFRPKDFNLSVRILIFVTNTCHQHMSSTLVTNTCHQHNVLVVDRDTDARAKRRYYSHCESFGIESNRRVKNKLSKSCCKN